MRIPPFDRYQHLLSSIGLFLAGGVVGSALFLALFHHNFTILYLQNEKLRAQNADLTRKVESLNKTSTKQSTISLLTVHIEQSADSGKIDAIVESKLKVEIAKDLQVVVGKPAAALKSAPLVYERLIDGHVYHGIRDKDYEVHVKRMMVIQSELIFWVTAGEFKRN